MVDRADVTLVSGGDEYVAAVDIGGLECGAEYVHAVFLLGGVGVLSVLSVLSRSELT